MSRQSADGPTYLSAQPGFLNAPRSGPQAPKESVITRFWRQEIIHPEKLAGNTNIAWAVGVFAAGVVFARTVASDLFVPVF